MAKEEKALEEKAPEVKTISCHYDSVTPTSFTHNGKEFSLFRGVDYKLPADNDYVQSLLAQNILVENK